MNEYQAIADQPGGECVGDQDVVAAARDLLKRYRMAFMFTSAKSVNCTPTSTAHVPDRRPVITASRESFSYPEIL